LVRRLALGLMLTAVVGCSTHVDPVADPRLRACHADAPGNQLVQASEVARLSDIIDRFGPLDRVRIGDGTADRPAFVAIFRGTFTVSQPALPPLPARAATFTNITCVIVRNPDGTYSQAEPPLFLGPIEPTP